MIVAVTGTPGAGKTSALASQLILDKGFTVIAVEELARKHDCLSDGDPKEVDVEKLAEKMERPDMPEAMIIDGHLSHHLRPDITIVLRCHPEVLAKRLEARGYSQEKVRENMEAEAIDLILAEAVEMNEKVYEIDATNMSPDEIAGEMLALISGRAEGREPGQVDWSQVIMEWY